MDQWGPPNANFWCFDRGKKEGGKIDTCSKSKQVKHFLYSSFQDKSQSASQ